MEQIETKLERQGCRDNEYTGQRILNGELLCTVKRPQRRLSDVVKEDIQRVGLTEENTGDRVR